MGRIAKAYRVRFQALLAQVGARRLEQATDWLSLQARRLARTRGIPTEAALTRIFEQVRQRLERWRERRHPGPAVPPLPRPERFLCDAGLGGLARWLRAAGYEALWQARVEDDALLEQARRLGALVLTTDTLLMERRLVRQGVIPACWVPPTLTVPEQLRLVLRELRLPLRPPRCMSCGGELRPAAKEALRDRIPPRTWRWLDDYFLCQRCDRLFWHGTHWQRIQQRLQSCAAPPP